MKMHRSVRMVVGFAAILLLARPFDCFANSTPDPKAMDCCLKGKCEPTAKSDECCKNATPESKALAISKAAASDSSRLLAQGAVWVSLALSTATSFVADPVQHPPPVGITARNLPLLI